MKCTPCITRTAPPTSNPNPPRPRSPCPRPSKSSPNSRSKCPSRTSPASPASPSARIAEARSNIKKAASLASSAAIPNACRGESRVRPPVSGCQVSGPAPSHNRGVTEWWDRHSAFAEDVALRRSLSCLSTSVGEVVTNCDLIPRCLGAMFLFNYQEVTNLISQFAISSCKKWSQIVTTSPVRAGARFTGVRCCNPEIGEEENAI